MADHLILSSHSPRRKQILKDANYKFEVKSVEVEESFPVNMVKNEVAEFLAVQKNKCHQRVFNKGTIITADTTVLFGDEILGKPNNFNEAKSMLERLSGQTHQVVTGVCISNPTRIISFSSTTDVSFKMLSSKEIHFYIDTFKPFDKAGGYGIQEWIGMIGVTSIKGCYYNVVGLPIQELFKVLKDKFHIVPFNH
ncbi:MAG: septum formation protein Maf [Flammeovirgaceae bacterium]|nr:septum formation protein Maf [Flammeovirgaceae bacterium]|tara:strand:+ start:3815 stop:4399 length:585 start_codon:yes stop_codon:yes gene_type:complete